MDWSAQLARKRISPKTKSLRRRGVFDQPQHERFRVERPRFSVGFRKELHMTVEETRRRAETMFKKEQRLREAELAIAEYQAELRATREKTARLRAQRLARDSANQKTPRAKQKGAA